VAAAPPTVGLHEDIESIVSALVARARIVTGMDIASAALRDAGGQFPMTVHQESVPMTTAGCGSGAAPVWAGWW
jgi:hypothetical protein